MSDSLWAVGVALVIAGSLGNNFGLNLVSYDHRKKEIEEGIKSESQSQNNTDGKTDIESGSRSTAFSPSLNRTGSSHSDDPLIVGKTHQKDQVSNSNNKVSSAEITNVNKKKESICNLRVIGVTIFVAGNLLTFAAFGFAAQSLLAALESVQFISNIIFAKYIQGEIITQRMLISTASIVSGNILVVIFSAHEAPLYTSVDIGHLYATNIGYWVYLGVALILWSIFHYIFIKYHNARVFEKKLLHRHELIEPIAFSISSSIIGTQAVLQAKCMSMLIQVSARGITDEFTQPWIWLILCAWIFFVVFWLRRLDLGLALFPATFIIPVTQVFFINFAIICGGIFFEEFSTFTWNQWVGFIFGVLMILCGVYGLAPVDKKSIVAIPDGEKVEASQDAKRNIGEETITTPTKIINDEHPIKDIKTVSSGTATRPCLDDSDMMDKSELDTDGKADRKDSALSLMSADSKSDTKEISKKSESKGAKRRSSILNEKAALAIKSKPISPRINANDLPVAAPVKIAVEDLSNERDAL